MPPNTSAAEAAAVPVPIPEPAPHRDPLAMLGLYGMESIATPVLASLVTGDPLLLVGAHGTAKTALAEALADALAMRFHAYDASKALFEDIIGFPNPRELGEGRVGYVPTALSIWGVEFVLVDELSRAAPAMQNKWLEVIRARRVMGLPVRSLQVVFAAMNPPGYTGARPLDPALVGRFGFIVTMPTVEEMTAQQVDAVIRTVTGADAPGCPGVWQRAADRPDPAEAGRAVEQLVGQARAALPSVLDRFGPPLVDYVRTLQAMMRAHDVSLDGRRLSLMYRALAAALAVEEVRGTDLPNPDVVFDAARMLLPGAALGRPTPGTVLYPLHLSAWEQSFAGRDDDATAPDRAACRVFSQTSMHTLLDAYEPAIADLSEEDHHEVVSRVVRPLREDVRDARRWTESVPALRRLVGIAAAHAPDLPLDVVSRVFDAWRAVSGLASADWDEIADLAEDVRLEDRAFSGDLAWIATRASIELTRDRIGDTQERADTDEVARKRPDLATALTGDEGEDRGRTR